jgi:hypothetical protein
MKEYKMKPVYNGTARDRNYFPLPAGSVLYRYLKFEFSRIKAVKVFR